jgi:hypothetical protein
MFTRYDPSRAGVSGITRGRTSIAVAHEVDLPVRAFELVTNVNDVTNDIGSRAVLHCRCRLRIARTLGEKTLPLLLNADDFVDVALTSQIGVWSQWIGIQWAAREVS